MDSTDIDEFQALLGKIILKLEAIGDSIDALTHSLDKVRLDGLAVQHVSER